MNKKILIVSLILSLIIVFSGCGEKKIDIPQIPKISNITDDVKPIDTTKILEDVTKEIKEEPKDEPVKKTNHDDLSVNVDLSTNKLMYVVSEGDSEAEFILEVRRDIYTKGFLGDDHYKIYKYEEGEWIRVQTGIVYDCYHESCDDDQIFDSCNDKPAVKCGLVEDDIEESWQPYYWESYTLDCEDREDVEFLREIDAPDGIYKVEYEIYSDKNCQDKTVISELFAVKQ